MDSKKKKKLILAGAGGWGKSWLSLLNRNKQWQLAGVVEPASVGKRNVPEDIPVFDKFEKALSRIEADALAIVTPHSVRRELIEKGLEAGLHLLVEKPLAASVEEARKIARLCSKYKNQRVMVSHNYRFTDIGRHWRSLLAQHYLGRPGFIQIHHFLNISQHYELRGTFRDSLPYNMVLEMSVQHFDYLRYLTGREVQSVYARGFQTPWQTLKKDYGVNVLIEMDNGLPIEYSASWFAPSAMTQWFGNWEIACEKGYFFCDGLYLMSRGQRSRKTEELVKEHIGMSNARRRVLQEFSDAIEDGRNPACTVQDHLKTLAVCFAVIESATKNKPVEASKVLQRMG